MIGLVSTALLLLAVIASLSWLRGYRAWEMRLIRFALLAHVLGALSLIAVYKYYYGAGDLIGYHRSGGIIAAHLAADFWNIAPRVLSLLFQTGGEELIHHGAGSSTGSMHALAAILSFLLGNSLLASSLIIASAAFYGKVAMYYVLRRELDPRFHRPALIGSLLVPSAVFWSGSLLKESVVMSFLGAVILGGYLMIAERRRLSGGLLFLVGIVGCGLFKAYLLVPTSVAAILWLYVRRTKKNRSTRPVYLVFAVGGILGLMIIIGNLFPRYDVFRAETQLIEEQQTMGRATGGSNYSLLSSAPASTQALIVASPWAVFTALFRPTIIEARNPLALANGLETLVLLIMFVQVLRRTGARRSISIIRESPILTFCAIFTLLLALGVGFATPNMGTLSRYRMPLIPFFVVLLGVLGAPNQKTKNSTQSPLARKP